MRDLDLFQENLDNRIQKIFHRTISQSLAEETGVISKHLNLEIEGYDIDQQANHEIILVKPKSQNRRTLAVMAILSWYLPSITRTEVQEYLRKKVIEHQQFYLYSYLESKEQMVYNLFREYDYTLSDLFGNILKPRKPNGELSDKGKKVDEMNIKIVLREKRYPIYSAYKRGYNDHGSRADISVKARAKANELSYSEILEIELNKSKKLLTISNICLLRRLEREMGIT